MVCKICESKTTSFAVARILRKYMIEYFRCEYCGFVQTEEPYWLEEAYSSPIADMDIGTVSRGVTFARIAKPFILAFFDPNVRFLDYGGGYGFFARLMRDMGFEFYILDKYCPNLFAKTFEADAEGEGQYALATAFEVFEHLVHPVDEIGKILAFSPNVLFNTLLLPASNPKPTEWWYYGTDHGQHVSFYTTRALSCIADRFHLNLQSDGSSLHYLGEKRISTLAFRAALRPKVRILINVLLSAKQKKRSLLDEDFAKVSGLRRT